MQKGLKCFSLVKHEIAIYFIYNLHVFSRKIDLQNGHLTGIFNDNVKHYPHLTNHKTKRSKY